MAYSVKETYYTLQGEGHHTGRPAVFLRFAGCNLWSGLEKDRETAICDFCDTDFVGTDGPGGGKFASAADLARHVRRVWAEGSGANGASRNGSTRANGASRNGSLRANDASPADTARPFVVCTGGEPLLQINKPLIDALHAEKCLIAVETNGTIAAPAGLDWICVSPKAGAELIQTSGDELKLVYRQDDAPPEEFAHLDFDQFYLQPMDGPRVDRFTAEALDYCRRHPRWALSLQTHKLLGIP